MTATLSETLRAKLAAAEAAETAARSAHAEASAALDRVRGGARDAEFHRRLNDARSAEQAAEAVLRRAAREREDATDALAALAPPDATVANLAEIREAEGEVALALRHERLAKLDALARILASVRAAHGEGPLPATWEEIAGYVEYAQRCDRRLDIRFEVDPAADRIHASVYPSDDNLPPCVRIAMPAR